MTKLIFLGTSSSIPTKTRDNTSFVFSQKKLKLLIDCPGSIIQKLIKADIDFRKLQNIHLRGPQHSPLTEKSSALRAFVQKLEAMHYNEPLTIEINPKYGTPEIIKTKK